MEHNWLISVVLAVLLLLMMAVSVTVSGFRVERLSVDEFMKEVNPPAVSKLTDLNGETILCVRFEDHISVKHSNRKVWKPTKEEMKMQSLHLKAMMMDEAHNHETVLKEDNELEGSCPEGTVGIRETKRGNVERARSVRSYAVRQHPSLPSPHSPFISFNTSKVVNRKNVPIIAEYAIATHSGGQFGAFFGRINAQEPFVMMNTRSTAQVWVSSGGDGINPIQVIEAGWEANPARYGDGKLRFFVYWTNDNYGKTGCYDFNCPGFIPVPGVGSQWIGKPYPEISHPTGKQIDYPLLISQIGPNVLGQGQEAGWYCSVNGYVVGYWPTSLFASMKKSASVVHWGGLVTYPFLKSGQMHTGTQMGSGRPPSMGYKECAYINNIKVWTPDIKTVLGNVHYTKFVSRPGCYDVLIRNGLLAIDPFPPSLNGIHLFYGGVGYSSTCYFAERDA